TLATVINLIFYPAGVLLIYIAARPLARLRPAESSVRKPATSEQDAVRPSPASKAMDRAWSLGHLLAAIGGSFWVIAGLVYPLTLRALFPEFEPTDMGHFFLSLLICGGIAWTLPYFLGTAVGIFWYYPPLIRETMRDPSFAKRQIALQKRSGLYVLAAALLPLTAAALHSLRSTPSTVIVLGAIFVTAVGVTVALQIYQHLQSKIQAMRDLLEV
ncbi:MAG: hypothetical protein AAF907_06615, partial [Planctomycetota bacterium]